MSGMSAWCHGRGRHTTVARIVRDPTAGVVQPDRPARSEAPIRCPPRPRPTASCRAASSPPASASVCWPTSCFDGRAFGINVAIATAGLLAAAWLLRRRDRAPDPLDAWLPVSAMILAILVAVRGDPFLAVLDSMVAFACCGASAAAFSGLAVTRRTASVIAAMGVWVMGSAVGDPFRAVIESRPAPAGEPRRLPDGVAAVVRGLVIAVPLAIIFAVLFASADPVFGRALGTIIGFRIDLGELPGRVLFVVATGWLAAGLVSVVGARHPGLRGRLARRRQPDRADARRRGSWGCRKRS